MYKTVRKIILIGIAVSFVRMNSYAEDKKYYLDERNSQGPNYNDPNKPNYISGTRTDMAPKVDISITEEENQKESEIGRAGEKYIKYIGSTFRKSPVQRAEDLGKSAAAGAAVGVAGGGAPGAAVGAIEGVMQGAVEELIDNVKWTLSDEKEK